MKSKNQILRAKIEIRKKKSSMAISYELRPRNKKKNRNIEEKTISKAEMRKKIIGLPLLSKQRVMLSSDGQDNLLLP